MTVRQSDARGVLLPTLVALPVLAVLLGLGTWQLQRKHWKDGLIAAIASRTNLPPVPLDDVLTIDGRLHADAEYRQVRVVGRFRHDAEQLIWAPDPRLGSGFHVVTPLITASGRPVLVNRGWVDGRHRDRDSRAAGLLDGDVVVTGIVRAGETPGWFSPPRDARTGIWYWRDLDGLRQAALGAAAASAPAVLIEAAADPGVTGGWPRGGVTRLALPNKHLEYAITWFGIAGTLVAVWLAFVITRRRASTNP